MRGLGRTRARITTTASATAAALVALAVLLTGCGGGGEGDSPQGGGDPSSSASPSPDPTPSELQGGTTVDGPAFTFTVAPDYELQNQDNNDDEGLGSWLRSYALDVFSAFSVAYRSSEDLSLERELSALRNYLIGRGTKQITRAEDLTLFGHDTAHLIGRSQYKVVHVYVVQLDEHYLEIKVEREPGDAEQKGVQRAMIDSLRLTE